MRGRWDGRTPPGGDDALCGPHTPHVLRAGLRAHQHHLLLRALPLLPQRKNGGGRIELSRGRAGKQGLNRGYLHPLYPLHSQTRAFENNRCEVGSGLFSSCNSVPAASC
eukprot:2857893-Pyramimonas_sp.AAC.2